MAKEKKSNEDLGIENIDKVNKIMAFLFIKRLITPVSDLQAFKLGLVDKTGRLIKEPETKEEQRALSIFDKFVFKLKRLMGSKLAQLNAFMFLQTIDTNFYDKLIVTGGIEKRAQVKRVERDMERLFEKYEITEDEFFQTVLLEQFYKKGYE